MSRLVEMHDEDPLTIDPDEEDGAVVVCRCGLSDSWPYCDNSHLEARDEDDGTLYRYQREDGDLHRETVDGLEPGEADPRD